MDRGRLCCGGADQRTHPPGETQKCHQSSFQPIPPAVDLVKHYKLPINCTFPSMSLRNCQQHLVKHLVTMQYFQVSDLHWNTREPPLLASSSLDGNIHVWDLRWSSMSPNCETRRYQQGSTEAGPVLPDDSGSLPHKVEPRGLHLPCKVLGVR